MHACAAICMSGTQTSPRLHPPAAINANGDSLSAAASSNAVVGAPLPPTIMELQAGVGQLALTWSAPSINADLGVTYKLSIADVTAGRDTTTVEVPLEGSPASVTGLAAGTKRVRITATNANTAAYAVVVQSALSDAVDMPLSTAPGVSAVVGSAAGATITVSAPSLPGNTVFKKFLIQVRRGYSCCRMPLHLPLPVQW